MQDTAALQLSLRTQCLARSRQILTKSKRVTSASVLESLQLMDLGVWSSVERAIAISQAPVNGSGSDHRRDHARNRPGRVAG